VAANLFFWWKRDDVALMGLQNELKILSKDKRFVSNNSRFTESTAQQPSGFVGQDE